MTVNVGVCLGRHPALVCVDSYTPEPTPEEWLAHTHPERRHLIRYVETLPATGADLRPTVDRIATVAEQARHFGFPTAVLGADDIGRPIVDALRGATSCSLYPVSFVSGEDQPPPGYTVHPTPARDPVISLAAVLETRRGTYDPGCPLQAELNDALSRFDARAPATALDGLALALCLAIWYGDRARLTDLWSRELAQSAGTLAPADPSPWGG